MDGLLLSLTCYFARGTDNMYVQGPVQLVMKDYMALHKQLPLL
jgi:hypothetical protein